MFTKNKEPEITRIGYVIYNSKKGLYKYGVHWVSNNAQLFFRKSDAQKDLDILRENGEKYLVIRSYKRPKVV